MPAPSSPGLKSSIEYFAMSVDYAGLINAFNAEDGCGRGLRATNGGELKEAIKEALANRGGPTLIECIIDRDDASPDLISWGRQVATATPGRLDRNKAGARVAARAQHARPTFPVALL
jgi:hypothetical protein